MVALEGKKTAPITIRCHTHSSVNHRYLCRKTVNQVKKNEAGVSCDSKQIFCTK